MDKILGGGIHGGTITDIFGSAGSGKTQIAMQFCTNAQGKIVYHDAVGGFRPERIIEMANGDSEILEHIGVRHLRNTAEQIEALSTISKDTSLIIVDGATDLFSFEYKQMTQVREKNIAFMQYMRKLVDISYEYDIPVVITNMIRNAQDRTFENMRAATSPFTHVKVHLLGAPASNVPRRGTVELQINGRYEFDIRYQKTGVSLTLDIHKFLLMPNTAWLMIYNFFRGLGSSVCIQMKTDPLLHPL